MPYIDPESRKSVPALETHAKTAGELNYEVTTLVDAWIAAHGGVTYANLNAVIGVLECAKLELYRRIAAPYEDMKRTINGDVYEVRR